VFGAIAPAPPSRYILPAPRNRSLSRRWPMRAEIQKIVEEIKQSVALLRRHL
jgi:hypothetical protein